VWQRKFWFRRRDGQGGDPTLLLPKRPSGYTMASVVWRWADLDEENLTTLVNIYLVSCVKNSLSKLMGDCGCG
jgi:hypothetical protein